MLPLRTPGPVPKTKLLNLNFAWGDPNKYLHRKLHTFVYKKFLVFYDTLFKWSFLKLVHIHFLDFC